MDRKVSVEAVHKSGEQTGRAQCRAAMRELALKSALRKRAAGVPTYTVAEAAALLSVSQEYLYRLIQAGEFPAAYMGRRDRRRRRVVPAQAVEIALTQDDTPGGAA